MTDEDLAPTLSQRAGEILRRLAPEEREAFLIKRWMSHDARWFMAAAVDCGMEVTNRLNRAAAREIKLTRSALKMISEAEVLAPVERH